MKNWFSSFRKKKKQNAVLYTCHSHTPTVMNQYRLLKSSLKKKADPAILFHLTSASTPRAIKKENHHTFTFNSLSLLGYETLKDNKIVPGSTHFPLIEFALKNPDYSYYWLIEYDVRYSGCWGSFFDYWKNSSADLLTCHIRHYNEEPDWSWWGMKHPEQEIPLNNRVRSFNPIFRISKRAINYIHKMQLNGWVGHHEELISTLLLDGGFTLEDMGGTGEFVAEENKNLFYIDFPYNQKDEAMNKATMRWRPYWNEYGELKNKLYHPVKKPEENG